MKKEEKNQEKKKKPLLFVVPEALKTVTIRKQ